jgi:hypothetical protein
LSQDFRRITLRGAIQTGSIFLLHAIIEASELLPRLSELAAHAQALVEVDGLGERGASGGEVATQGVQAEISALKLSDVPSIVIVICFSTNFC